MGKGKFIQGVVKLWWNYDVTEYGCEFESRSVKRFFLFSFISFGGNITQMYIYIAGVVGFCCSVGSTIHSYIVRTDHLSTHTTIDYSNFFFFLHR